MKIGPRPWKLECPSPEFSLRYTSDDCQTWRKKAGLKLHETTEVTPS